MSTSAIFAEAPPNGSLPAVPHPHAPDQTNARLERLENEVSELRETIARFADLVLGEVKDLRKTQQDLPDLPPSLVSELPADPSAPVDPNAPVRSAPVEQSTRRPWLLTELLRDIGSTFRMYLDPRYRMRRATQMMVPLILALFALNCYFFNVVFTMSLVSRVLEKFFDVMLAVMLYQVLHREVLRYRYVIGQLTAWHDYRARVSVVSEEPVTTRLETE